MLQASGSLTRNPLGGSDAFNTNRRSIYVRVIRNNLDPFLSVFDMPVPATAKGRRDETNVPAQSLTMMNDPFVISMAARLAQRYERRVRSLMEHAEDPVEQFERLTGRRLDTSGG